MDNTRIQKHLERVLQAEVFLRAERQSRLLQYIVQQTIVGKMGELKEYAIALDVFGRSGDYDPKVDSTVRVEVSKLRARLERYYQDVPGDDGIRIEIPKGAYVARFVETAPLAIRNTDSDRLPLTRRQWAVGGIGLAGAVAAAVLLTRRTTTLPPVFLVDGETAESGGYTAEAAQLMHSLSNRLGFAGVPAIQAKDLEQLASRSEGTAHCITVMAGRCWEDASRLRLVAELREVSCGFRIRSWVGDRETGDAASLARDGAKAIVDHAQQVLADRVSPDRKKALTAYRAGLTELLSGKDFVLQSTDEKLRRPGVEQLMKTARLLEEAGRLDPGFAEPQARLAWVYRLALELDRDMLEPAVRAVEKALSIDAMSVHANFVKGYLDMLENWNIAGAESSMRKCIERSAFHIEAYRFYSDAAAIRGRAEDALAVIARPLSVMPRSKILRFAAVTTLLHCGRGSQAERLARESLRWEPDWPLGRWLLGRALESQGRVREAEIELRAIHQADRKSQRFAAGLAHLVTGSKGRAAYAEGRSLLVNIGMDRTAPSLVGLLEARCGDLGRALDWMERAEREHDHNLPYSVIDPHYRPLRGTPRGERIYKRFAS